MALPNAHPIGWREGLVCALIPVLIEAMTSLRPSDAEGFGKFLNPDSYMRLVRLRDIVAAHRPLHAVARDASGHGTVLHWSHLLDSFILLLAAPLGWFMPDAEAHHVAGLLFGSISLAALGYASAWAVAPFAGPDWRWMAPVAAILGPAVWGYGQIGVVHHHISVVLVAVVCWGWAARLIAGSPGGVGLGAWAAAGLWLTPEALPLSVLAFGAVFVVWVERGGAELAAAIRATGLTLLVLTTAAWFVDPPAAGHRAVEFGRISIVFVGVSAVFAVLGCALVPIDRRARNWGSRLIAAALAGLVVCGLWLLCFPAVLDGSSTLMSDTEWHIVFDHVVEMQPVKTVAGVMSYLFTGLLGLLFLGWLAIRHRSVAFAYAFVGMAVLIVFGAMHVRFSPYPEAAAALLVPVVLDRVRRQWPVARIGIVVLILVIPLAGFAIGAAKDVQTGPSCEIGGMSDTLAQFGDVVVLANVNITPELLYRTQLKTVGSLYSFDPRAFLRLWAAWRSRPGTARTDATPPPQILATEATLLIFCPTTGRSPIVADLPEGTLMDWLNGGQIPRWLHEVARDPASGTIVYRIQR
jgi:hypothetical protein